MGNGNLNLKTDFGHKDTNGSVPLVPERSEPVRCTPSTATPHRAHQRWLEGKCVALANEVMYHRARLGDPYSVEFVAKTQSSLASNESSEEKRKEEKCSEAEKTTEAAYAPSQEERLDESDEGNVDEVLGRIQEESDDQKSGGPEQDFDGHDDAPRGDALASNASCEKKKKEENCDEAETNNNVVEAPSTGERSDEREEGNTSEVPGKIKRDCRREQSGDQNSGGREQSFDSHDNNCRTSRGRDLASDARSEETKKDERCGKAEKSSEAAEAPSPEERSDEPEEGNAAEIQAKIQVPCKHEESDDQKSGGSEQNFDRHGNCHISRDDDVSSNASFEEKTKDEKCDEAQKNSEYTRASSQEERSRQLEGKRACEIQGETHGDGKREKRGDRKGTGRSFDRNDNGRRSRDDHGNDNIGRHAPRWGTLP